MHDRLKVLFLRTRAPCFVSCKLYLLASWNKGSYNTFRIQRTKKRKTTGTANKRKEHGMQCKGWRDKESTPRSIRHASDKRNTVTRKWRALREAALRCAARAVLSASPRDRGIRSPRRVPWYGTATRARYDWHIYLPSQISYAAWLSWIFRIHIKISHNKSNILDIVIR